MTIISFEDDAIDEVVTSNAFTKGCSSLNGWGRRHEIGPVVSYLHMVFGGRICSYYVKDIFGITILY
jgi:hypothetical protein